MKKTTLNQVIQSLRHYEEQEAIQTYLELRDLQCRLSNLFPKTTTHEALNPQPKTITAPVYTPKYSNNVTYSYDPTRTINQPKTTIKPTYKPTKQPISKNKRDYFHYDSEAKTTKTSDTLHQSTWIPYSQKALLNSTFNVINHDNNKWSMTKLSIKDLANHPAGLTILRDRDTSVIETLRLLYRHFNDSNCTKQFITTVYSQVLEAICYYNYKEINKNQKNQEDPYNNTARLDRLSRDRNNDSIILPALPDYQREYIELKTHILDITFPEPQTFIFKETYIGKAKPTSSKPATLTSNGVTTSLIDNYANQDDREYYNRPKYSQQELNAMPSYSTLGTKKVQVETRQDQQDMLTIFNFYAQHPELYDNYEGAKKLSYKYKTLQQFLDNVDNYQHMIDYRPAPSTLEEIERYRQENLIIAQYENVIDDYNPDWTSDDLDDYEVAQDLMDSETVEELSTEADYEDEQDLNQI